MHNRPIARRASLLAGRFLLGRKDCHQRREVGTLIMTISWRQVILGNGRVGFFAENRGDPAQLARFLAVAARIEANDAST